MNEERKEKRRLRRREREGGGGSEEGGEKCEMEDCKCNSPYSSCLIMGSNDGKE